MSTPLKKEQSASYVSDHQVAEFLADNPEFFSDHPELLAELAIPHNSGGAVSLIERQIVVLRGNNHGLQKRLKEMIVNARDNQRLAESQHRLAINLLNAEDHEDVINISLEELRERLRADYAVIRLISDDESLLKLLPERFIKRDDPMLNEFKILLRDKRPVCGRASKEQIGHMFGDDADQVRSAAIIPLVAGNEIGLLGLGSGDDLRFQVSMSTDFLSQIGELISAALIRHSNDT